MATNGKARRIVLVSQDKGFVQETKAALHSEAFEVTAVERSVIDLRGEIQEAGGDAAIIDMDAARLVSQARSALTHPPLSGTEAQELDRWKALVRVPRGLPTPEPQARLEARIKEAIDENMHQAARTLAAAAARLEATGRAQGMGSRDAVRP